MILTLLNEVHAHWQNQEINYDFHAQLQGTGSCNEVLSYQL